MKFGKIIDFFRYLFDEMSIEEWRHILNGIGIILICISSIIASYSMKDEDYTTKIIVYLIIVAILIIIKELIIAIIKIIRKNRKWLLFHKTVQYFFKINKKPQKGFFINI